MPLTTPHESASLVAAAIRTGITANPTQADVLREIRSANWPQPQDVADDLQDAIAYIRNTALGALTQERFRRSMHIIAQALDRASDAVCTQLRDRLRAGLTAPAAPQWLKDDCERLKRALRLQVISPTERAPDRQDTDPCVVAAEAALLVLAAAGSTREQIAEAARAIENWRQLTPVVPDPVGRIT